MAVASLAAVGVVVAVAVLASGVREGDDSVPGVAARGSATAADVVITALTVVGLVLLVVMVIAQLAGGGTGGRRVPSRQRQLIGVVTMVVVAVLAAYVLPDLWSLPETTADAPIDGAPAPPAPDGDEDRGPVERSNVGVLAGVILGLVVVALGAAVLWPRRGDNPAPDLPGRDRSPDDDRDLLGGLLDEAIAALRADPDPRRAVITAWARVEVALGAVGMPRHESEAPFPYLARILGALDASGPAVRRLTEVFERAKFSPHRIEAHHQQEAIDALVAVRDELRLGASR